MLLKVCGLKYADNLQAVAELADWVGLIFYPKSGRYMRETLNAQTVRNLKNVQKVGVFVNEDFRMLQETADTYALDLLQLHGNESPDYCRAAQATGRQVIKVFSVSDQLHTAELDLYADCADYFLFDTQGKDHGGNGQKFNWAALQTYRCDKPFLLSGGIAPTDAPLLQIFSHPACVGYDVNSKFEEAVGKKDITQLQHFVHALADAKLRTLKQPASPV